MRIRILARSYEILTNYSTTDYTCFSFIAFKYMITFQNVYTLSLANNFENEKKNNNRIINNGVAVIEACFSQMANE